MLRDLHSLDPRCGDCASSEVLLLSMLMSNQLCRLFQNETVKEKKFFFTFLKHHPPSPTPSFYVCVCVFNTFICVLKKKKLIHILVSSLSKGGGGGQEGHNN